jgi:hypothetical protein
LYDAQNTGTLVGPEQASGGFGLEIACFSGTGVRHILKTFAPQDL